MSLIRKLLLVVALLAAAIQFVRRPDFQAPPSPAERAFEKHHPAPPAVIDILRRGCYDCHSHETRWPWYSRIAPVSWWINGHVQHAREEINFSDWPDDPHKEPTSAKRLDEMCEEVREGHMPLPSYKLLHPAARLSPEEVDTLCAWTVHERSRLSAKLSQ